MVFHPIGETNKNKKQIKHFLSNKGIVLCTKKNLRKHVLILAESPQNVGPLANL